MRVALDATALTLTSGGLRRYTSELSLALAREFPEDSFVLLSDQEFPMPAADVPNLTRGRRPRTWWERRWWLCGVGREMARRAVELFHGTDFAVPYLPRHPSVLTLHDLSPWMNPAWHTGAARVRRRAPALIRLGLATMVLTPSRAVRAQAIDAFGIHPSRIVAVPHAASSLFHPVPFDPAAPPYFLSVATLEPRKNVAGLLAAWRLARRTHAVELWLAGRRRADFPDLPPEPGLRCLGEVPDGDLPSLYSGALAVLYPSWYEGFGLPVLEAMQCAACVIASTDPALRELAAGAALTIDAADVRALAAAMTAVLERPDLAADYRCRAAARARLFSWQRSARLTREVYAEAIRRFS